MADVSSWIDRHSRYQYADVYSTADKRAFVSEREPMDPPPEGQFKEHTVARGDSCISLAGLYYHGLIRRPARFWWAIMEVNKIIDPTQPIRPATVLKIPDIQYVLDWIGHRHDITG